MAKTLDIVLLLALPASGKSEVRKYLARLSPEQCRDEFHMGPTVQIDDFPYVHAMRRIDDELAAMKKPRIFFKAPTKPFQDTRDWGTLIQMLNEDYEDLLARRPYSGPAAPLLLQRLDTAAEKVGLPARLAALTPEVREALCDKLEAEAAQDLKNKLAEYPDTLEGKTLVVEFARGGPDGSEYPLPAGYGYRYSLAQLSPAILERATILYIWVTPEESRRKNDERADPNDPGSILHHGVPLDVMLGDYGCDDIDYLEKGSEQPGTITVKAHDRVFHLPIGRFDNRVDKTTFIRKDAADWTEGEVKAVHEGLMGALDQIATLALTD